MYNKKYVGIAAVVFLIGLLVAFTMFWGCSDNSSGPSFIHGDLDDPEFVAIRSTMETVIDSVIYNSFMPLTNRWGFPLDSSSWEDKTDWWLGTINPDEDTVDYQYTQDGWHIIYMIYLSASGSQVYYDSLSFYVNTSPWMMFTDEVDNLKYRGYTRFDMEDEEEVDTVWYQTSIDIENVNTLAATASGDLAIDINSHNTEGENEIMQAFGFEVTVTGLEYTRPSTTDWDDYDEVNGSFEMTLAYTYDDGTTPVNQAWTIEVTVDENVASIEVIRGNTRWTYDYNL